MNGRSISEGDVLYKYGADATLLRLTAVHSAYNGQDTLTRATIHLVKNDEKLDGTATIYSDADRAHTCLGYSEGRKHPNYDLLMGGHPEVYADAQACIDAATIRLLEAARLTMSRRESDIEYLKTISSKITNAYVEGSKEAIEAEILARVEELKTLQNYYDELDNGLKSRTKGKE